MSMNLTELRSHPGSEVNPRVEARSDQGGDMTVPSIAYFTMEISLDPNLPTYAGGLGVLAGDTIRSAADLGLPMVAVSLLYRKGYVEQRLDEHGHTTESEVQFSPEHFLTEQAFRVAVQVEGRIVDLRSWCYPVQGVLGHTVPVYFLDADLPENDERDRRLTDRLYGGDERYRLSQEVVLGIGGVRLLRALGLYDLRRYHMNEGHAALLTLELLEEEAARNEHPSIGAKEIEAVRSRCVFTTHTPVRAGHDHFPRALVREVLGSRSHLFDLEDPQCREMLDRVFPGDEGSGASAGPGPDLNLTYLALNLSCYVNAVAEKHGEVSRRMFSGYEIDSITNGVHALTWTNPHFREVFDRHLPGWREDNFRLRCAMTIPAGDIWESHQRSKEELCELVRERTGTVLSPDVLTLGFARRATAYKRPDLLLTDLDRLQRIAAEGGGLQMVFAGKAHPRDHEGKNLIRQIFAAREQLESDPSIKSRVPGELRNGDVTADDQRRRHLAEYTGAAQRGLRHQRHEGGPQRRAQPQRARRLVDRRSHRRRHRLVHRR